MKKRLLLSLLLALTLALAACGANDVEDGALKIIGKTENEATQIVDGTIQDDALIVDETTWGDREAKGVYTITDTFRPFQTMSEGLLFGLQAMEESAFESLPTAALAAREPSYEMELNDIYVTQYDASFTNDESIDEITQQLSDAYPDASRLTVNDEFGQTLELFETDHFLIVFSENKVTYIPSIGMFEPMKK